MNDKRKSALDIPGYADLIEAVASSITKDKGERIGRMVSVWAENWNLSCATGGELWAAIAHAHGPITDQRSAKQAAGFLRSWADALEIYGSEKVNKERSDDEKIITTGQSHPDKTR